jgi:hypothetical protein
MWLIPDGTFPEHAKYVVANQTFDPRSGNQVWSWHRNRLAAVIANLRWQIASAMPSAIFQLPADGLRVRWIVNDCILINTKLGSTDTIKVR